MGNGKEREESGGERRKGNENIKLNGAGEERQWGWRK